MDFDFQTEYNKAQQVALEKQEWQHGPSEEVANFDNVQFCAKEFVQRAFNDFIAIEEQTLIEMGQPLEELNNISPLILAEAFSAFYSGWMTNTAEYLRDLAAKQNQE